MRRIRGRDSGLEMMFRRAVWRRGARYRLNANLPGKPDMVFPGPRVAVFVDSCFWHKCPDHCREPSSNTAYWGPKLERNSARDIEVTLALEELGWRVARFWEHEMKDSFDECVDRLVTLVARDASQ